MKRTISSLFLWTSACVLLFLFFLHSNSNWSMIDLPEEESRWSRDNKFAEQELMMLRDPQTNSIPMERLLDARRVAASKRSEAQNRMALPINWESRGPNNIGGRTRALLFDANDPTHKTVFAGSVSGGLWRTDDISAATVQWVTIDDFFEKLTISSIVQDPINPDILYFGTGEGFLNGDSGRGLGIWKSIDGGSTWDQLPSTNIQDFWFVNKLLIEPNGFLFAGTHAGVFRSADGGNSWEAVLNTSLGTVRNRVADLERASNGDLYAAVGLIFDQDGIYQSKDSGTTWVKLTNGLPTQDYNRINVAVAPSNPQIVYAVFNRNNHAVRNIYRTDDAGANWRKLGEPSVGSQGWYNLTLEVDPNDPERFLVGGVRMAYSLDGGVNYSRINGIHADQHTVVFEPGNSEAFLIGNDGGVYYTTDGLTTSPTMIDKNNGYVSTQFYTCALHPTAGVEEFLGGTQDNGTIRLNQPGLGIGFRVAGGDGAACHYDTDDPDIQIGSFQNNIQLVTTNSWANVRTVGVNGGLFISPTDYDSDQNILYASAESDQYAYITDIGGTNTVNYVSVPEFREKATAFRVSPSIPGRIYVGAGGEFYSIDNAASANPIVNKIFTGPFVFSRCLEVDLNDENHLLAVNNNFGIFNLWETYDGGNTWTTIDGDLPDMPVWWAVFAPNNPNQVIIATELGVWSTDQTAGDNTSWEPSVDGLANVRVTQIKFRESDRFMIASGYGRGIYSTDYFTQVQAITGNIQGTVFLDDNRSGIFECSLPPCIGIADIPVQLFLANDLTQPIDETLTETGTGIFQFSNITANEEYIIRVLPPVDYLITPLQFVQGLSAPMQNMVDREGYSNLIELSANETETVMAGLVDAFACTLDEVRTETFCFDNGTADPGDDFFTIQYTPTGRGAYSVSGAVTASNIPYTDGVQSPANTFPISGGPISITVSNEASDPSLSCEITSIIDPPLPCSVMSGGDIDLELSLSANNTMPAIYDFVVYHLEVINNGPAIANDIIIDFPKPTGLVFTSQSLSKGDYNEWTGIWEDLDLQAGESAVLDLTLFTLIGNTPITAYAQVLDAAEQDIDSQPGNGLCCVANEDDEAVFTIGPGGSNCTLSEANWTVVCFDQGTSDPLDDTYTVFLDPDGTGLGATYSVSGDIIKTSVSYGQSQEVGGPLFIRKGPIYINITDVSGTCSLDNIRIDPPAPCSLNPGFIDLELTLTAANTSPAIYDFVPYQLVLKNNSPSPASGVELYFPKPQGLVFTSQTVSKGDYNEWTGVWKNLDLQAGESAVLDLTLFTLIGGQAITAYAQVTKADQLDGDSTPDNGICCTPQEDDEAAITIMGTTIVNRQNESANIPRPTIRNIYPNPSTDRIIVAISVGEAQNTILEIYGNRGELLKTQAIALLAGDNEVEIAVDHLASGLYFLNLQKMQRKGAKVKFVVQRE